MPGRGCRGGCGSKDKMATFRARQSKEEVPVHLNLEGLIGMVQAYGPLCVKAKDDAVNDLVGADAVNKAVYREKDGILQIEGRKGCLSLTKAETIQMARLNEAAEHGMQEHKIAQDLLDRIELEPQFGPGDAAISSLMGKHLLLAMLVAVKVVPPTMFAEKVGMPAEWVLSELERMGKEGLLKINMRAGQSVGKAGTAS